jgi:hypothetical protein
MEFREVYNSLLAGENFSAFSKRLQSLQLHCRSFQRGFDHRPLHFNIWSAIFARQSARMEYNWGTVVSTSFLDWFRHVLGGQTPSQARNLDCRVVGLAHATFTLSGELVER